MTNDNVKRNRKIAKFFLFPLIIGLILFSVLRQDYIAVGVLVTLSCILFVLYEIARSRSNKYHYEWRQIFLKVLRKSKNPRCVEDLFEVLKEHSMTKFDKTLFFEEMAYSHIVQETCQKNSSGIRTKHYQLV